MSDEVEKQDSDQPEQQTDQPAELSENDMDQVSGGLLLPAIQKIRDVK